MMTAISTRPSLTQRWSVRTLAPFPVTIQEALRCLGLLLDESHATWVWLTVEPAGIRLVEEDRSGPELFSWDNLVAQQQIWRWRRGRVRAADPTDLTRWEVLLRVIGRLLDELDVTHCDIHAVTASVDPPRSCHAEASSGGRRLVSTEDVLNALRSGHGRA
jgi:hypothetical protein